MQRRRMQRFGLALVAAGALGLSTLTGAEARPFGLMLHGGFPHLGGFGGGFHHFGGGFPRVGGFGGGFRPGGGGFRGGALGFRQPGGGSGFRQADRGFGSAGGGRRYGGSGRGRYWAYGAAAAAAGALGGAYSSGDPSTDSDTSGYPAYGYSGYPAYGYGYPAYGY
jgi:hypothetical protein